MSTLPVRQTLLAGIWVIMGAACTEAGPTVAVRDGDPQPAFARPQPGAPGLVVINARGRTLDGPDEIPAGWTTFRLNNESGMVHFAVLERLPEGIGLADQQAEVAPVFQEGMDLLNAGEFEAALAKFGELPSWFNDVVFLGGPGFIRAGGTAETTVYLEPGTYLLECYVKTDGVFHSFSPDPHAIGMVHEITVADRESKARAPRPTLDLTISSTGGIEVDGTWGGGRAPHIRPGRHTVAVHFADQVVHEHFLGHDVHLARLEDDADLDELATWMNWTGPTGLETLAPAEFLGGVHEMPAGSTGYFHVLLRPGRYAWISEVPDPAGKGMLRTFTVP